MNEWEGPEVCPSCHHFRSCICAPKEDASEPEKRAHRHYEKALKEIEKIVGPRVKS